MYHVEIKPELIRWACGRAGRTPADLQKEFAEIELWERGEAMPTFEQLERFAQAVHVPIGYLFSNTPPEERIPIPDLRTVSDPDPELLDTIYLCQRRQDWYRDYAISVGEDPRYFVGSMTVSTPAAEAASEIRQVLGFDPKAPRLLIEQVEEAGILVMVGHIARSNSRFALADDLAPLVFINDNDGVFALTHEIAHLWLGESALSDVSPASVPSHDIERWCSQVAAELSAPNCLFDNQQRRASQRFVRALVASTLEGHTLYREAIRLLGAKEEHRSAWEYLFDSLSS